MNPSIPSAAEQVSALADGHLHDADMRQALQACERDPELLNCWRDYHLIGDVLRGVPPLAHADESGFLARLRPALAQEPARPALQVPALLSAAGMETGAEAANEPRFRWRRAAGLASLAMLAVATWTLVAPGEEDEVLQALGETPVLVANSQGMVIRDAALEELLQAHREQGGASVLPMPSGFLRNATFEAAPASVLRQGPAPHR